MSLWHVILSGVYNIRQSFADKNCVDRTFKDGDLLESSYFVLLRHLQTRQAKREEMNCFGFGRDDDELYLELTVCKAI